MKEKFLDVIRPNKVIGSSSANAVLFFWIIATAIFWMFSGSKFIPRPMDVIRAGADLFVKHDFLRELITSLMLCIKAMFYSILLSLFLAYLSVIPLFRPLSAFVAKSRFLTTIGLTFIFALILPDTSSQKVALLVFGISVFLVTSMLSVVMDVKKDDLDYARTLRLNEWQVVWEVVIRGRLDQMFEVIRQNFAIAWMMLAMVENICRADGGIGIVLGDQNKHFHLDAVYAIQIMVLIVGICADRLLSGINRVLFPYSHIKKLRK